VRNISEIILAAQFDTPYAGASVLATRTEPSEIQTACPRRPPMLQLSSFTPFRLNRLAAGVSDYLSQVYRERFGLEIPEWRVIATVGPECSCTAQHIADSTRMHKTRVSRAIAHLVKRGLIERASNVDDRREMELRLTESGRELYNELIPLALERERALLSCLPEGQLRAFTQGLGYLEEFLRLA
jgi:DNA-binding MarR family transcriptional regulator